MVNFIKSLKLRWSDMFLAIGFACFGVFAIFGQLFMQYQNPSDVALPLPAIIVLFVIGFGSWITYLVLEHKQGNFKPDVIFIVLAALAIFNAIVIACQPSEVTYDVVAKTNNFYPIGTLVPVNVAISPIHKTMFALEIILICMFIYIGLFVFPKRFTSVKFIQVFSWIILIGVGFIIFISYCIEDDTYFEFLKALFHGAKPSELLLYTVKSCVVHRNAYGMILLLGIIFAIVNHTFNHRRFNYVLMFYFLITMVHTLCKTSLIIGALLILIYIYYRLIITFKDRRRRNIRWLAAISTVLLAGVTLVLISAISKGKYLGFLYVFDDIGNTLVTRSWIWQHSFQTLSNGNWAIGRGFGIINLIIYPMNQVNNDFVFPTHSAFVNMICEGGPLYLLAYLALIVYVILIIKKCWKKDPKLVFALTLGIAAFFLYGVIETIQYVMYALIFPLFVFYELEVNCSQN